MSGGRVDPKIEHAIYWEMWLPRVLQYYHCALRASLQWTVPPSSVRSLSASLDRMNRLAAPLLLLDEDDDDED